MTTIIDDTAPPSVTPAQLAVLIQETRNESMALLHWFASHRREDDPAEWDLQKRQDDGWYGRLEVLKGWELLLAEDDHDL